MRNYHELCNRGVLERSSNKCLGGRKETVVMTLREKMFIYHNSH